VRMIPLKLHLMLDSRKSSISVAQLYLQTGSDSQCTRGLSIHIQIVSLHVIVLTASL